MGHGKVARGTLYMMAAQSVFIISGYAIHVGLARILGPATYGVYGVVMSLLVWIEMVSVIGIPTAVEKYVAQQSSRIVAIQRSALPMQIVSSGAIFVLLFVFAPVVAGVLGDDRLGPFIRIAAIDIPIYALFHLYAGLANGMRDFGKQAAGMILYSVTKLTVILALVYMGLSLNGAFVGNIIASLAGCLLLVGLTRPYFSPHRERAQTGFDSSILARFALSIALLVVGRQMLRNLDLFCVKAFIGDDVLTGFYTAAVAIARTPSFIFVGLLLPLFPSVARSIANHEETSTRSYIRQALRFLLVLATPMIFLVVPTSRHLLELMFSAQYAPAAPVLSILIVGWVLLTFLMALTSIMVADGKPYTMALVFLVLNVVDFLLILWLVPVYGMSGAAWATTISVLLGLCILGIKVFRRFGAVLSPASVGKVLAACGVVGLLARLYQAPHVFLLVEYVVLFGLYLGILYGVREITRTDIDSLVSIMIRKRR